MGTPIHPAYATQTKVSSAQTPFIFRGAWTPQYGYGSAYPASHRRPQTQGEGKYNDNVAAPEFSPAPHPVNDPTFGAYPSFPIFDSPAHPTHGAFTPHTYYFPTYYDRPFFHAGYPPSGSPVLTPRDAMHTPYHTTQRALSSAQPHDRSIPEHDRQWGRRNRPSTPFMASERPVNPQGSINYPDRQLGDSDSLGPRPFAPPPTAINPSTFNPIRPPLTTPTGRHGISSLLNFELDAYPFVDWIICQDLSFARQWVHARSGGGGRCRSVNFNGHAVVPPVHRLQIRPKDRNSLLGQAMKRWGEIEVRRFDHFITVGDVMHAIWDYFQEVLTYPDRESIINASMDFANRVAKSYGRRCNGRDRHRRCDALLGSLRFGGLEIDFDFETTSALYLSLENLDHFVEQFFDSEC